MALAWYQHPARTIAYLYGFNSTAANYTVDELREKYIAYKV
ncbi:MAG TPA: hypothetical protein VMU83_14865 [Hanamia sp.]|nr:hypothetical protein [Hanamia sp.]